MIVDTLTCVNIYYRKEYDEATQPTNKDFLLLSQVNDPGYKGVLGAAVDVAAAFQDAGHSKHGGLGHFIFIVVNGLQQVVCSVIQPVAYITEALRVGSPQHYHLQSTTIHNTVTYSIDNVIILIRKKLGLGLGLG